MKNQVMCAAMILTLGGCALDAVPPESGPMGETGERGERGAVGPVGAPGGLEGTAIVSVNVPVNPGDTVSAHAECPSDSTPVGGGCQWGKAPGDVLAWRAVPTEAGYLCAGVNVTDVTQSQIVAYAVCAVAE